MNVTPSFSRDRAKLPKVTRVDTNVNVCGRYFIRSVLADVFDQFEERLARFVTIPDKTHFHLPRLARVPLLHLHAE